MGADIELQTVVIPGSTKKVGQGALTVEAGQWLQIRHGTLASPVVDLQEQCPAGKVWHGTVEIHLTESDL